ncbi:MAG TPA: tetratricopeptide repeat protein, partial [Thermoanaerobaculia bacterium]|nr:tetratricopeptide repeat protein [Thermoanaerobaculia bacterium]
MTRAIPTAVLTLTFLAPAAHAQKAVRATPPSPVPISAPAAAAAPTAAPASVPAPSTASEVARGAAKKLDAFQAKEARAALEPVVSQAGSNADVAIALGRLLEQEKKYDESAAVLRTAAAATPADGRVPLWLGETLLRAKKMADADAAFSKAVELATQAIAARPDDAGAFLVQGSALSRLRRYDEAMVALGKARELDGGSPATLYQMGATRAFQQRWADAVTLLSQTLEKETGMALAYYYRGLAQEKLGRKDLMVVDLDRFVKVAPAAPEADRARALLAAA